MRILIVLCLAFFAPLSAAAAPTLITVSGDGSASAMPDMATVSFTIATSSDNATAAMSDNNSRYNGLSERLTSLGIPSADVQTTGYNLWYSPRPKPPEMPQPGQRYGFFVSRTIQVTLHRTSLAGKAVDAAAQAGITDIGGVSFGVSDTKGQLAQALRAAVLNARAQAQAMASAAGLRIVRIKQISQGYQEAPQPQVLMRAMAAPAPAPPTEIAPSSQQLHATVTVVFEAQ